MLRESYFEKDTITGAGSQQGTSRAHSDGCGFSGPKTASRYLFTECELIPAVASIGDGLEKNGTIAARALITGETRPDRFGEFNHGGLQ